MLHLLKQTKTKKVNTIIKNFNYLIYASGKEECWEASIKMADGEEMNIESLGIRKYLNKLIEIFRAQVSGRNSVLVLTVSRTEDAPNLVIDPFYTGA